MLASVLTTYVDAASDDWEIGVAIYSGETGEEIAMTFDVVADINEYGELMIRISI